MKQHKCCICQKNYTEIILNRKPLCKNCLSNLIPSSDKKRKKDNTNSILDRAIKPIGG